MLPSWLKSPLSCCSPSHFLPLPTLLWHELVRRQVPSPTLSCSVTQSTKHSEGQACCRGWVCAALMQVLGWGGPATLSDGEKMATWDGERRVWMGTEEGTLPGGDRLLLGSPAPTPPPAPRALSPALPLPSAPSACTFAAYT